LELKPQNAKTKKDLDIKVSIFSFNACDLISVAKKLKMEEAFNLQVKVKTIILCYHGH